jgi:hypothetical protein
MARKLSKMSIEDMRQEMSCAGSPCKIIDLMVDLDNMIWETVDSNSIPELINISFALDRIKAEVRLKQRKLERVHSAKVMSAINNAKNPTVDTAGF